MEDKQDALNHKNESKFMYHWLVKSYKKCKVLQTNAENRLKELGQNANISKDAFEQRTKEWEQTNLANESKISSYEVEIKTLKDSKLQNEQKI